MTLLINISRGCETTLESQDCNILDLPVIKDSELGPIIEDICVALTDEIETLTVDPSRSFDIFDGKQVYQSAGDCLYVFKTDATLPLPPDTPIGIDIQGRQIAKGVVVNVQDFDVLLQIDDNLGDTLISARVSSEPWFIIDHLRNKLRESLARPANNIDIPLALVARKILQRGEDHDSADGGLEILFRNGQLISPPNDCQQRAIRHAAGSQFHIIWGPPGTGKTVNLAHIARILRVKNEKIMVLAHANAAVDVAMLKIADAFFGSDELLNGKILRVGLPQLSELRSREDITPEGILKRTQISLVQRKRDLELQRLKISEAIKKCQEVSAGDDLLGRLTSVRRQLEEVNEELRSAAGELIRGAKIIGTTLSRFAIDNLLWSWAPDTVLIDETSMANFPAILAAALQAQKRLLLFGDFRQLPPIRLADTPKARLWLGRDAFEVSGVKADLEKGTEKSCVTMLEVQYRMAQPIADAVSRLAYGNRLRTEVQSLDEHPISSDIWSEKPLVLVDTSALKPACFKEPREGSYSRLNPVHCFLAHIVADKLMSNGCSSLGMITPYRAQARLLAAMAGGLHAGQRASMSAATVHKFQGSERDAIIFDLVDAPNQTRATRLTGDKESSLRLLNVGLSRAKNKLIVLADLDFIKAYHRPSSPARKAIKILDECGYVVQAIQGDFVCDDKAKDIRCVKGWEAAQEILGDDLSLSRANVLINLPDGFLPSPKVVDTIKMLSDGTRGLRIYAPPDTAIRLEDSQADIRLKYLPVGFFAVIDRRTIYLSGYSPDAFFYRYENARVAALLEQFFLGPDIAVPVPNAEMESTLSQLCGRCPDCGENRRPHYVSPGALILTCGKDNHSGEALNESALKEIVDALKVTCSACGAPPIVHKRQQSYFLGCPNHRTGCTGYFPKLSELFGRRQQWHS